MTKLARKRTIHTDHRGIENHSLAVVGDKGGIHFHFRKYPESLKSIMTPFTDRYPYDAGGVEVHKRCTGGEQPNHESCWLLGEPCYHDGSSLYASEVMLPLYLSQGEEAVFIKLEIDYVHRLENNEQY
jgi:hypothetical protein